MDIRLYLLALGAFAIGAESFVVSSLLPPIAGDMGVSITQAGYLVLLYALGYAAGAPLLAAATGAHGRRNVLTAAALVFTVGAVFAACRRLGRNSRSATRNGTWQVPLLA